MAFLTYTDGTTTLTLDVSMSGASEVEPDRIGGATRAFAGNWRTDEQEFRKWNFVHPLVTQADYATLRGLVKGGKAVTVKGDAVESAGGFTALVRITQAPFSDDARQGSGWSRDIAVTIAAGVSS